MNHPILPASLRVDLGGRTIHLLDWGGEGKPNLLLLHGIRLHAHVWNDFCRRYRQDFRILAMDQRGHGDSDWSGDEGYHLHGYYEDLLGVIEHLGVAPLTLLGHSLGARVATLFTHLHPEMVKQLVLVDMGPGLPANFARHDFSRVTETPPPKEFPSPDAAVQYITSILRAGPPEVMEESVRHGLRQLDNGNFTWKYDPSLGGPPQPREGVREWDLWEAARSLRCPTMLLYGAESQVVSEEIVTRMRAEIPGLQTQRVEKAGHALFTDQPDVFAHHTGAFLGVTPK